MKNKGFTLVEMLAVLVILGLLIGIGVFTVDRIKDNAEKNYYVSMEDTLKIAGNDYFNDNREDRPIDDYNFVSLETLEEHSYLDPLKTYDKKENCDKSSGVYIYNTENGNEYEVCLKCGIHKSTGLYCNGKKTGQIMITGSTNTGGFYNPTLSYAGTPWTNASSVNITFTLMGEDVKTDKFEIYNGNNDNLEGTCTSVIDNSCTKNMSVTGSYYVVAYDGVDKVGNRKYFNVKIDNMAPTFDIKDMEEEKDLENKYDYPYSNEVINIHDDNGYKTAVFSLKELVDKDPSVNIVDKDLTASNLKILENLQSGKFKLTVTVTDYARNSTTKSLEFTIKYNVNMVYFDNNEVRHDVGTIRVYKNGFYDGLLAQLSINGVNKTVDWYDNTNYTDPKYDASNKVNKTSTHTLYGREKRIVIPESNNPHCNYNNDFTYNNNVQELVTEQTGYHLTNHRQKDAGTYTIIAMPDANFTWSDNTRTYKIIQCTIKRYKVTIPNEPCVGGLIYNGSNQVLIKNEYGGASGKIQALTPSKDLYTFSPITGKNAGTYDVDFNLPDKTNLEWTDGTQDNKTYKCSIAKYTVSAPSSPCKSGLVYNNTIQMLIKDGYGTHHSYGSDDGSTSYTQKMTSFNEVIYQATPDSAISAGNHNVSFILSNPDNFQWSDGTTDNKSFTCTIAKYSITAPTSPCRSGLVYNGMMQKLVNYYYGDNNVSAKSPPDASSPPTTDGALVLYYVNGWYAQSANDHTVTYRVVDSSNFEWSDGTTADKKFTCTIAKYKADIPADPCASGLEYNKNNQSLLRSDAPSSPKLADGDAVWVYKGSLTAKNAGNYKVKASLRSSANSVEWSDGTTADKEFTCKIAKAPVTWQTDRTLIYTGYNAKEQALVLTMISKLGDHISLRLVPTTVHSDHVYNADVNFAPGDSVKTYAPNYYITNPKTTIGFTNDAVTITAGSSEKEYDGKPLTDATYKESGSIAANGETLSSVTNTGSQTDVGTSDNVPSAAVIKYGGINTTSYYSITYKEGTLKVVDTTAPTCSVSVSEDGVLSAVVNDNYKLWTYGWDNYWNSRSTTKTITAAGKYTFLVRDTSDNRTFCYLTVTKVKQKATVSCKTYNSCATSGCGCDKYNSCATEGCGCSVYKSCATEGCGCGEYKSCANSACGCKTYNSCANSACGCKTFNSCEDSDCGCKTYKTCANSECGCSIKLFGVCLIYKSCATSGCGCKTYETCEDSDCGCSVYKTCATSGCGCSVYKTCATSGCGCKAYNSCANSACGCKTYNSCENSACGCKTYTTCANSACGCKEWNSAKTWTDDKNCSEGEASDHTSKTLCREIYRGS